MNKISIVMPVFNVENYIAKSVNSICSQTDKSFELIVVNDGSQDSSIKIAKEELDKSDIEYKIIEQNNQGLSSARNTGIKASTGDWILFVDSDDALHPNTIEVLMRMINDYNVDIVAFSYEKVKSIPEFSFTDNINLNPCILNQSEFAHSFFMRSLPFMVTTLLLKKDTLFKNNLLFNDTCKFSEDQLFIWPLIFNVDKIAYISNKLYFYLLREGSIMTASNIDTIKTGFNQFIELDRVIHSYPKSEELDIDLDLILPRWVFGSLHSSSKRMSYCDFRELENAINYNNIIYKLFEYPDIRIKAMVLIHLISKRLFYLIAKNV